MKSTRGIYICLFDTGIVKVGKGVSSESRISSHSSAAKCFGVGMVGSWIFPCGDNGTAEKELLKWCGEHSTSVVSREWFYGVDVRMCQEIASQLASLHAERPQDVCKQVFEGLCGHFRQSPSITREASAYLKGRQMTAATGILNEHSFKSMDSLHALCELIRSQQTEFNVKPPEWFETLNCMESWEVDLMSSEGLPDASLVEDINSAFTSIMEAV